MGIKLTSRVSFSVRPEFFGWLVGREEREDQHQNEKRAEDGSDQTKRAVAERIEEVGAIGGVLLLASIRCRSSLCIAPPGIAPLPAYED